MAHEHAGQQSVAGALRCKEAARKEQWSPTAREKAVSVVLWAVAAVAAAAARDAKLGLSAGGGLTVRRGRSPFH
ncbi:hypothetical protein F5Y03DRAFT_401378 [Xylaria venustula]|nr:hypothetical protein F5Y03DRAFT_401378 [Xylaria venustula]